MILADNFKITELRSIEDAKAFLQRFPIEENIKYFNELHVKQKGRLEQAISLLQETGRSAYSDEIRQYEDRIKTSSFSTKITNYPQRRWLGNKQKNEKVDQARKVLGEYDGYCFFYGGLVLILTERKVVTENLYSSVPTAPTEQKYIKEIAARIEKEPENASKKTLQNTLTVIITFILLFKLSRSKARKVR